jgi:hypothetical protein
MDWIIRRLIPLVHFTKLAKETPQRQIVSNL